LAIADQKESAIKTSLFPLFALIFILLLMAVSIFGLYYVKSDGRLPEEDVSGSGTSQPFLNSGQSDSLESI
jgi:hypothetical protein